MFDMIAKLNPLFNLITAVFVILFFFGVGKSLRS